MSILDRFKDQDFFYLVDQCRPYFQEPLDATKLFSAAKEMIDLHKAGESIPETNGVRQLERRWYRSLKTGRPDYHVYNDAYYLADIWACWVVYSRRSLQALSNPTALFTKSVVASIAENGPIVDLGCGFGFTTLGLAELFPNSRIYGTNLETSYQYQLAKKITSHERIKVIEDARKLGRINMVFASEYFEHIERPIEHLHSLIATTRPNYFITANGFNGTAIGHFPFYKHLNEVFDNRTMSKLFNRAMRQFGYEKLKSKIWNSRPAIWRNFRQTR